MIENVKPAKRPIGKSADVKKQEEILVKAQSSREDFYSRVGSCTQSLNQFLRAYARDYSLSQEEVIAAVYLENLNNRTFYEKGAVPFDEICKDVFDWFEENKSKP